MKPRAFGPGLWRSAVVYALPQAVAQQVEALRAAATVLGVRGATLPPHVTLLYLHEGAEDLVWVSRRLMTEPTRPPVVSVCGLGAFPPGENAPPANLHLRLNPSPTLLRAHLRAVRRCRGLGWEPQTPYKLHRYLPHISIVDRIEAAPESAGALLAQMARMAPIPAGAFPLGPLHSLPEPVLKDRGGVQPPLCLPEAGQKVWR